MINKLYRIERTSKDASVEERFKVRQQQSLPILETLRQWVDNSQFPSFYEHVLLF
jgi:hypothetical protein